jgi:hypothetical protein
MLEEYKVLATGNKVASHELTIDSAATIHIEVSVEHVKEWVTPNRDPKITVSGIDSVALSVTHVGIIPGYGRVFVVPGSSGAITSVPQLTNYGYKVTFEQHEVAITHSERQPLYGRRNACNHYVATRENMGELMLPINKVWMSGSTEQPLSTEQKKRAAQVRLLHSAMYHVSDAKLSAALTYGTIVGTTLTARDVRNAERLFGPCIACKAGKTKRPGYSQSENEPAERVGDVVHVDIYVLSKETIGGYNYMLFAVDEFSGYLSIVPLTHKNQKQLLTAFTTLIAIYQRHNNTIKKVQTDHEANLWSCNVALGMVNIQLTQVAPYRHAQRVERYVQEVNQKMRCTLAGIKYRLPKKLRGELIGSIVYNHNDIPGAAHPQSTPRIIFEGRRLELSKRIMVPFGALVIMKVPGRESADKMTPRAEVGIVLGPSEETYGAMRCYSWETQKVVTRENLEIVPNFPSTFPFEIQEYKSTADFVIRESSRTNLYTEPRNEPSNDSATDDQSESEFMYSTEESESTAFSEYESSVEESRFNKLQSSPIPDWADAPIPTATGEFEEMTSELDSSVDEPVFTPRELKKSASGKREKMRGYTYSYHRR